MHTLAVAAIVVTLNGAAVRDADVCAFQAQDTESPYRQLFASDEVVCNATLAPGLWNVFARRGTELVSARSVLIDTRKTMAGVELRLEPAARLSIGDHAFIYINDTLSALPAIHGVALVPADREIVPLLVRDGTPIAIGDPLRLAANATKSIVLDPAKTHAIATWITIAPEFRDAVRTMRRKQPPQISAAGKRALNPLRSAIALDGALQFIRDVPKGTATIELSGTPWKRQTKTVEVPAVGVAVTTEPLTLVPASSAVIKWTTRQDLPPLMKDTAAPCKPPKTKPAPAYPIVSLLTCRGAQTSRSLLFIDRDLCKSAGSSIFATSERSGEVTFHDIDPGVYVAEFAFGVLPKIRDIVRVERFDQTVARLDVDYSTLYGRVTRGGDPLSSRAHVRFGFAEDAFTDDDGNYVIVLPKPVAAGSVISVQTCDNAVSGEEIVGNDILPNSRFDIDLPANAMAIEAVDKADGTPVAGALVRYGAFRSDQMSAPFYFRLGTSEEGSISSRTDAQGHFTIRSLPPDKTLRVCLEHEDYERTCTDPMTLALTETKTLRIAMKPIDDFKGRIAGVSDVAGGQLYWFASDGQETERTTVRPDGTFRFGEQHAAGEAVVFVSLNHPLFAFVQPQLAPGDPLNVEIPPAASRSFAITIGETNAQEDAIATIAIGNLVVPYPAFAQHLALHGSELELHNRGPLVVPDILETAPISAILGPPPSELSPAMHVIDLFRLPQYRGLPRKPIGADGRVVFAVRATF